MVSLPQALQGSLFVALRSAFPADLDATAIEALDAPGGAADYSWRDLDRATARIRWRLQVLPEWGSTPSASRRAYG